MRPTFKTAALAASLALAGSAIVGGPAMADPKGTGVQTLTCGGTTYDITVNGNGQWTPAHDSNSSKVFIPVGFANFTGAAYDVDGNLIAEFTDPSVVFKTGVRNGQGTPLACTFEGSEGPVYDEEFGQIVTFTFSGDVLVKTKK